MFLPVITSWKFEFIIIFFLNFNKCPANLHKNYSNITVARTKNNVVKKVNIVLFLNTFRLRRSIPKLIKLFKISNQITF